MPLSGWEIMVRSAIEHNMTGVCKRTSVSCRARVNGAFLKRSECQKGYICSKSEMGTNYKIYQLIYYEIPLGMGKLQHVSESARKPG